MVKNERLRKRDWTVNVRKVNLGVTLIGLSTSVLLSGWMYYATNDYRVRVADNKAEIAKLEGDLTSLKSDKSDVTVKEIEQNLNSATTLGNSVTDLQNSWGTPLEAEDMSALSGSDNQSADAVNKSRIRKLQSMFSTSDAAGSANWYNRTAGFKSEDAKWEFMSTISFTTAKQNVMWQCLTDSGELYAYATAVYNADAGVFENVNVQITSIGAQAQSTMKGT